MHGRAFFRRVTVDATPDAIDPVKPGDFGEVQFWRVCYVFDWMQEQTDDGEDPFDSAEQKAIAEKNGDFVGYIPSKHFKFLNRLRNALRTMTHIQVGHPRIIPQLV